MLTERADAHSNGDTTRVVGAGVGGSGEGARCGGLRAAAALATQRAAGGGPCGAATRRWCCRTCAVRPVQAPAMQLRGNLGGREQVGFALLQQYDVVPLARPGTQELLGAVGGADAAHVHAADAQGGPSPPAVPALSRLWHRPRRGRLEDGGGAVGAGWLSGSAGRRGACPGRCAGRGPCAHQCWAGAGRVWRQAAVPDQQQRVLQVAGQR